MNNNIFKNIVLSFAIVMSCFALFAMPLSLVAADNFPTLVPNDADKKATGNYTVNDMLGIAVTVSKMVLLLSGSVALLAFIYGGFMMILSAGNKDMVEKGKSSLTAAVIGLLVVLLAFTAVNYFMTSVNRNTKDYGQWNGGK